MEHHKGVSGSQIPFSAGYLNHLVLMRLRSYLRNHFDDMVIGTHSAIAVDTFNGAEFTGGLG